MNAKWLVLVGGILVAAVAVSSLVGQAAPAQGDKVAEEEAPPPLVLREYDIAHLLAAVPDYNFAFLMDMLDRSWDYGGGGGAGISLFEDSTHAEDEESATQRLRDLIERAVRTKEPWESMGGRATLDFYERSGRMLVSTTELGHDQIAILLDRITTRALATLVITVRAVELKPEFADRILDSGEFVMRTDDRKKALSEAVQRTFARTSVSGLSGQHLSNNSGAAENYVADIEPIVAESAVGWDPTIRAIPGGLAVGVNASTLPNDRGALLRYAFCYARKKSMRQVEVQSAAAENAAKAWVDMPTFDCDQRAGTVALPLGCPAVVAGGTVPLSLVTGAEADGGKTVDLSYVVTVHRLGAAVGGADVEP